MSRPDPVVRERLGDRDRRPATRLDRLPPDLDLLADRVVALTSGVTRPLVLVDGGSGAGKTRLALELVQRLEAAWPSVRLVSLDSVYPGWSGLAAASAMTPGLLDEHPGHPTWDWAAHRVQGWVDLPTVPLVVEGCGSLTPQTRELASVALWCDLDAATRKQRALGRDGDEFAPWWDHWAQQEAQHWRSHHPLALADLVIDMAAPVATPSAT